MEWRCGACGGENPEKMRFCGHCGTPAGEAVPEVSREKDVNEALRSFVSAQVADKLLEGGGAITEERRLVTCLFADLSGFTPLADRLDPEELLEVIDPVIRELTSIVGRYEGYVDKFAGDALLAFFGAPISREDDAERALAVAEEMHASLAAMLPNLPPDAGDLTLHIGVNTGHVIARVLGNEVRMDYSVLGDAVILAQRLESAAPAGETYVGNTTHLLTKHAYDFESVGELSLKGKKEPVSAWRLTGLRERRSTVPTTLVGRAVELDQLESAVERGRSVRSVVTITAAPGLGKTSLLQATRERSTSQDHVWLQARCLAYGSGIAYWPFIDVVRRVAGVKPSDTPEKAMPRLREALKNFGSGEVTPYILRLLGYPAPEVAHYGAENFRRELHLKLAEAIEELTQRAPLVLVIEDAHWADLSSLQLVTEILRRCAPSPLTVIFTARPEGEDALRRVVEEAEIDAYDALDLVPLSELDTRDVVATMLQSDPPDGLASIVWARTGGNPLFTHEVVRSLLDSGVLKKTDEGWVLDGGDDALTIPPTIEGVLSARMDLLPRGVAPTLQMASVIGRRVRLRLLENIHPDPPEVRHHLETLVKTGFLEEDTDAGAGEERELVFHHALMQDVAYSRLLRKTRRVLHQRVAEVAERLYGSGDDTIDLLARHLYLGQAGSKAIDYLIRAGDRSKRLFANDEAILHYSHAAELARAGDDDRGRLNEILLQLGDLHEIRGEYEAASTFYEQVRGTSRHVRAWAGLASSLRSRGEYDQALGLLDQAFEQNGWERQDAALLWHEKGWLLARQARFGEAIEAFEKGLEIAGSETSETVARLLVQLTRAEIVTGRPSEAVAHIRRGTKILEDLGDVRGLARALRVLGDAYNRLGRLDEAFEALQRGLRLAHRTGDVEEIGGCFINLGLVEMERKDFDEAVKWTQRAIEEFGRIEHSTGLSIGYGNVADFLLQSGRLDEAVDNSIKALEIASAIGDMETVADVKKTLATIRYRQGNFISAADTAQEAAALYDEMGAADLGAEARELVSSALKEAAAT